MQNTIDDAIAILQAFKEGKTIQYLNSNGEWSVIENPAFNFHEFRYRIKPETVKVKVALFCGKYNNDILVYTEKEFMDHVDGDPYFSKVSDWFEIEADHDLLQKAKS